MHPNRFESPEHPSGKQHFRDPGHSSESHVNAGVHAETNRPSARPVLLFDGECNLCNYWVDLVIARDPDGSVKLAPLQSRAADQLLQKSDCRSGDRDSVIFLDQYGCYERSDAVLRLAGYLNGPMRLLRAGVLVPRFFRDRLYDFVARKRYRWFGRRSQCRLPDPAVKERFLPGSDLFPDQSVPDSRFGS